MSEPLTKEDRTPRPVPWRIGFHLLLHNHALAHYEPYLSVPSFDPHAKGIWAVCSCGKTWAL